MLAYMLTTQVIAEGKMKIGALLAATATDEPDPVLQWMKAKRFTWSDSEGRFTSVGPGERLTLGG